MNLDQERQGRAGRMLARAIRRFKAEGAVFVRYDGEEMSVPLYKGRPSFTDESTLGLRATAYVTWICSKGTLLRIKEFVGGDGFFGGCTITYSGDTYYIDKLVPYVESGLGGGYTIQTTKMGPDSATI